MSKIHKMINLPKEIDTHIKELTDKFDFKFSQWVTKKFIEEFMQEKIYKQKIEEKKEEIEKLKIQLQITNKNKKDLMKRLNRKAKEFIETVPRLLKEGKKMDNVRKRFNEGFGYNFTKFQFEIILNQA